jgi:hypothetical protein
MTTDQTMERAETMERAYLCSSSPSISTVSFCALERCGRISWLDSTCGNQTSIDRNEKNVEEQRRNLKRTRMDKKTNQNLKRQMHMVRRHKTNV